MKAANIEAARHWIDRARELDETFAKLAQLPGDSVLIDVHGAPDDLEVSLLGLREFLRAERNMISNTLTCLGVEE